jgi:outer membrane lipoprotein SlyB
VFEALGANDDNAMDGAMLGSVGVTGALLGANDGATLGMTDGAKLGTADGAIDGPIDGSADGE